MPFPVFPESCSFSRAAGSARLRLTPINSFLSVVIDLKLPPRYLKKLLCQEILPDIHYDKTNDFPDFCDEIRSVLLPVHTLKPIPNNNKRKDL
jgi:hypothetical protein